MHIKDLSKSLGLSADQVKKLVDVLVADYQAKKDEIQAHSLAMEAGTATSADRPTRETLWHGFQKRFDIQRVSGRPCNAEGHAAEACTDIPKLMELNNLGQPTGKEVVADSYEKALELMADHKVTVVT